jgi:hypothetical protein
MPSRPTRAARHDDFIAGQGLFSCEGFPLITVRGMKPTVPDEYQRFADEAVVEISEALAASECPSSYRRIQRRARRLS